MRCENCGIPSGTLRGEGRNLTISIRAENNFKRDRKANVWTCSDECAVQTLGIARYGSSTRNWPVTLAKFRATRPLEAL